MKFLLVVLAIHFVGELINTRPKKKDINEVGERNELVRHPAEFELR